MVFLNAFSIISGFNAMLRIGGGGLLAWLGGRSLLRQSSPRVPEQGMKSSAGSFLLVLWAGTITCLNLLSWPLMYLVLATYVSQIPGAMCIYGVMRFGEGSLGLARYLPFLIHSLEFLKLVTLFASGAWLASYFLNRSTQDGRLGPWVASLTVCLGAITLWDATFEISYLLIPKHEEAMPAGCCTVASTALTAENKGRGSAVTTAFERPEQTLTAGFYFLNGGLVLLCTLLAGRLWSGREFFCFLLAGGLAVLAFGTSLLFLIQVASPKLIHLPYHRCAYDLVQDIPESVLAIVFYVFGSMCIGWTLVVQSLGRLKLATREAAALSQRLMRWASLLLASAVLMMSVEFILA